MPSGGDKRGVCYLKTNTLEKPRSNALMHLCGQAPAYSPYVTREQTFNSSALNKSHPAWRIDLLDPRVGGEWDSAVARHPESTIFHTSAWAKVLCETYGHAPNYVRLSDGEKTMALMPMMEVRSAFTGRRGVCLPFSDFCGPLVFEENSRAATIDRFAEIGRERNWKYFEVRSTPAADSTISSSDTFYGHKLDLTKCTDELFDGFASSVRRAIRKAERSGLAVEVTSSLQAVREFYRLHTETRRRHGIPPQPRSFFDNIHRHIMARGLGYVVIARHQGRPIAASVFFHFGRNGLFKFGASDDRDQELRANNLVMWAGIKHAAQLGLHSLHLGRTDLEHEGLRRFKLSLGADEEILHYFRFDPKTARSIPRKSRSSSPLSGALFRRLPLTINRLAGTVLYPHLH